MLSKEAEYWWDNAHQILEETCTIITLENLKKDFLEKYFLPDVCNHKEFEFLELKQGNMIMADYATKFEELSRFCPIYNGDGSEGSKCVTFESGMRLEIK